MKFMDRHPQAATSRQSFKNLSLITALQIT